MEPAVHNVQSRAEDDHKQLLATENASVFTAALIREADYDTLRALRTSGNADAQNKTVITKETDELTVQISFAAKMSDAEDILRHLKDLVHDQKIVISFVEHGSVKLTLKMKKDTAAILKALYDSDILDIYLPYHAEAISADIGYENETYALVRSMRKSDIAKGKLPRVISEKYPGLARSLLLPFRSRHFERSDSIAKKRADNLRNFRKRYNLSQNKVARICNVERETISLIEHQGLMAERVLFKIESALREEFTDPPDLLINGD